ncbi:MAG: hypothetical protein ACYS8X_09060, partial [Planctomycetota bacterium]
GVVGVCFTEHAGQLYVSEDDFWRAEFLRTPALWRSGSRERMDEYSRCTDPLRSERVIVGFESEVDYEGRLILREEDRARADILLGAVHWLNVDPDGLTDGQIETAFLKTTEQVLAADVTILAHPMRYFYRSNRPVAIETCRTVARMLAETDTAPEINFHKNDPPDAFVEACLKEGLTFTLGTDTHAIAALGNVEAAVSQLRRVSGADDIRPFLEPIERLRQ